MKLSSLVLLCLLLVGCSHVARRGCLPAEPGFYTFTSEHGTAPSHTTPFMVGRDGQITWLHEHSSYSPSIAATIVGTATGWAHEAVRGPDDYDQQLSSGSSSRSRSDSKAKGGQSDSRPIIVNKPQATFENHGGKH